MFWFVWLFYFLFAQVVFFFIHLLVREHLQSVAQKSEKIAEEELKCRKMAEVAQADLAEALPALEEAKKV